MIGMYSRVLSSKGGKVGGGPFVEEMIAAITIPELGPGVFRWRTTASGDEASDEDVRLLKMCDSDEEAVEFAVRYKPEDS